METSHMGAGDSRARTRRPADAHAAILKAAERIFAESGLAGARTDEIARKAGVNKALLYYYFTSKDDLYLAVLEMYMREFRSRALAIFSRPSSVRVQLLQYINLQFDMISSNPHYPSMVQRLMTAGPKFVAPILRRYQRPLYRALEALIERGVANGELRPVDPHHTVFSLAGLINFYFAGAPIIKAVTHVDPFDSDNIKRRKKEIMSLVRFGLFRDLENTQHETQSPGVDPHPRGGRKRRGLLAGGERRRRAGVDRHRRYQRGHR